ncbi:hypothetical protein DFH28DRAFT_1110598 [Melampsora americana]|nr:hypothetical protein DFH28DRAFT_1110598 [Melampsora americana]
MLLVKYGLAVNIGFCKTGSRAPDRMKLGFTCRGSNGSIYLKLDNLETMKTEFILFLFLWKLTRVSPMENVKSFESMISNEALPNLPPLHLNMHQHNPQDFQSRSITYYWPCGLEDTQPESGYEAATPSAWLGEARLFLNKEDAVRCITSQLEDKRTIPGPACDNILHGNGSQISLDVAESAYERSSSSETLDHGVDSRPFGKSSSFESKVPSLSKLNPGASPYVSLGHTGDSSLHKQDINVASDESFPQPFGNWDSEKRYYESNPSARQRPKKYKNPVKSGALVIPTQEKMNEQLGAAKVNQAEQYDFKEKAEESSSQNRGNDCRLRRIPRKTNLVGEMDQMRSFNHWNTRQKDYDPRKDGKSSSIDRKGRMNEVQTVQAHSQDLASSSSGSPRSLDDIELKEQVDQLKLDQKENNSFKKEYLENSSHKQSKKDSNEEMPQLNILSGFSRLKKTENKGIQQEVIGIPIEKTRDGRTKDEFHQRKSFSDSLKSNLSDPQNFKNGLEGLSGQNRSGQKATSVSAKEGKSQISVIKAQPAIKTDCILEDAGKQDGQNSLVQSDVPWQIKKGKKWIKVLDSIQPHSYVLEDTKSKHRESAPHKKGFLDNNSMGNEFKEMMDSVNVGNKNSLEKLNKNTTKSHMFKGVEDTLEKSQGISELIKGVKKTKRGKKLRKKTKNKNSKVPNTEVQKRDDWDDIPILPHIHNGGNLEVSGHLNLEKLLQSIIKPDNKEDFMYINVSDGTANAIMSNQDYKNLSKLLNDITLYKHKVEVLLGEPETNRRFQSFQVQFSQKLTLRNWEELKNQCDSDVRQAVKLLHVHHEWPVFYNTKLGESKMVVEKLKILTQTQLESVLDILSLQEICQRLGIMKAMEGINSQGLNKVFSEKRLQFFLKQGVSVPVLVRMEHLLGLNTTLDHNFHGENDAYSRLLEIYNLMHGKIYTDFEPEAQDKTKWIHSPVRKYLFENDERLKIDFEDRLWCIAEQGKLMNIKLSSLPENESNLTGDLKETSSSLQRIIITTHFGITTQGLAEIQIHDPYLTDAIFSGTAINAAFYAQRGVPNIGLGAIEPLLYVSE